MMPGSRQTSEITAAAAAGITPLSASARASAASTASMRCTVPASEKISSTAGLPDMGSVRRVAVGIGGDG
ncbi:hypothetical protein AU476_10885 [Cupriavidus sp. UYMSc13B]|nr:hypothetical protein AU476_10885 [Cupriavidus sp. UYMSc13B]